MEIQKSPLVQEVEIETLIDIIKVGRNALRGDSNDAEHDALYEIVTTLESMLPSINP